VQEATATKSAPSNEADSANETLERY
jgi:hypothetical protein